MTSQFQLYARAYTQDEQKTRRHWLILTICLFSFPTSVIISLAYQFVIAKADTFDPVYVIPYLMGAAAVTFVPFWLLWRCSYIKRGTAFLRSWIAISFILRVSGAREITQQVYGAWEISLYILELTVYGGWFIFSLRLLKINRIFSLQKQISKK